MDEIHSIFLIDDEKMANAVSKAVIRLSGFTGDIHVFNNARSALASLQLFAENKPEVFPQLILLDVKMPLMDAWAFLTVYEKLPETVLAQCKVVLLSANLDDFYTLRAREYITVKGFISKPLTIDLFKFICQ